MIITKDFLSDLKKSNAIVVRFNGKYSSIDVFTGEHFSIDRRVVSYDFDATHFGYEGSWHCSIYRQQHMPVNCFIDSLRANDVLDFVVEDHTHDSLRDAGMLHYQLHARVKRYKKDGLTLSTVKEWFVDSQVSLDNSARYLRKAANYSKYAA